MYQQKSKKKLKEAWTARALAHIKTHTWDKQSNPLPKNVLCERMVCRSKTKPICKTMIQPQYNPQQSLKKALIGEE